MEESAPRLRVVSPHEMFFSLTNRAGVITGANSVFSRISRYSHDELMGAPHNLIRNPIIPGGVFRLMWDTILAGRPFAGYVQSYAKDQVGYWVMATVTPIPEGFLSVRTAPCAEEAWLAAASLYEEVLAKENKAREQGASRRKAAEIGRDLILEGLGRLGFPSYEDFMAAVLPTEVEERARRSVGARPIPPGSDPRILDLRERSETISNEASVLLTQLESFRNLSRNLGTASQDASKGARGLAAASAAASAASERVATAAPAVFSTARAMEKGGQETLAALDNLAVRLDRDQRLLRGLQIRIALSKLHSDMAVAFADDILAEPEDKMVLNYLPTICNSVESTVTLLAEALKAHVTAMQQAVAAVEGISASLAEFQSFLFMWRSLLIRHGVSSGVADHLAPIDHQLSAGSAQVVTLRELAKECSSRTRVHDVGPMLERVHDLARTGQAILDAHGSSVPAPPQVTHRRPASVPPAAGGNGEGSLQPPSVPPLGQYGQPQPPSVPPAAGGNGEGSPRPPSVPPLGQYGQPLPPSVPPAAGRTVLGQPPSVAPTAGHLASGYHAG